MPSSLLKYLSTTFCSLAALTKFVAIIALTAGFAYLNRRYLFVELYEVGDFAANSLLIQHAKHWDLTIGHYSRVGFNHPGPAILYVLAFGEWLFYDYLGIVKAPLAGQLIAVGAYNAFWIVMLATLFMRMYRSITLAGLALTLMLLATIYFDYNVFLGLWFPHLFYLPFAAFTLALILLIAGRGDSLLILTLSCGFLVHGHVSFIGLCGVMLCGALWVNHRQTHAMPRLLSLDYVKTNHSAFWLMGVLFLLFLCPLLLETLRHFPGPLVSYVTFGAGNHHHSPASALQFLAMYWNIGITPVIVAILALLFFAQRGAAIDERLSIAYCQRAVVPALLLATLALLLYALYGIDDLSLSYIGLFYYSVPALAVAIMLVSFLYQRGRVAQIIIATIIAALAIPYTIRQLDKPVGYAGQYHNAAIPEYYQKIQALNGPRVLDLDTGEGWGEVWTTLAGIEAYAARHPAEQLFCINKNWHILFTAAARCTEQQLRQGTRYFVSASKTAPTQLAASVLNLNNIGFYKVTPLELTEGQALEVAGNQDIYSRSVLLDGWSNPEAEFVWSESKHARLAFSVAKTKTPARLELDLKAFLPFNDSQQTVTVVINGITCDTLHFNSQNNRGKRTLTLPVGGAMSNGIITVQFDIDKPQSPKAAGISNDLRSLGIGLYGMELKN